MLWIQQKNTRLGYDIISLKCYISYHKRGYFYVYLQSRDITNVAKIQHNAIIIINFTLFVAFKFLTTINTSEISTTPIVLSFGYNRCSWRILEK